MNGGFHASCLCHFAEFVNKNVVQRHYVFVVFVVYAGKKNGLKSF